MDIARGRIVRGGLEVPLKPKAFRLLVHLLQERDRLVYKEELIGLFWTETAVTDALAQCIARLRRALGDDPRKPVYLKTVPRMGYRFVGPVQEILPETVQADCLGFRRYLDCRIFGRPAFFAKPSLYRRPAAVPAKRVVTILPFGNRSGQSKLDWMREGLPDMLATIVSRSKSLDVVSHEQVFASHPKGQNRGIAADLERARRMQAQAAVTGSLSKLGNSMRVDVRIYDTHTGALLGAEGVSADRQDKIFPQIDLLAGRLVRRLAPLSPDQDGRELALLRTDNLEAYRYYSLGSRRPKQRKLPRPSPCLKRP